MGAEWGRAVGSMYLVFAGACQLCVVYGDRCVWCMVMGVWEQRLRQLEVFCARCSAVVVLLVVLSCSVSCADVCAVRCVASEMEYVLS